MNIVALGNSLSRIFQDEESTQTVLATKPARKLLHKAFELLFALSERDLERMINYMQKSGKIDFHDLEDLENIIEASGFVKQETSNNSPEEQPAQGKEPNWQERVQEKILARKAGIGEATVSTEVKTLPETRKYMKALATAQGLHTQELAELLMVEAINKNTKLVKQGEEYLSRFKGNITAARRYAISQKLSHLEALKTPIFTPSL